MTRHPHRRGEPAPVVDWRRVGRRLRVSALVLATVVVAGWLATGMWRDALSLRDLGDWIGLGLAGMLAVEVVVVGGSAVRGLLRAGDRGDRLAGGDVGLLPPRVRRQGQDAADG